MKQYLVPFLVGVCLVACCLVFFQIGRWRGYASGYDDALNLPHKADTIFKVDTHFIDRPVEKWRTVEKVVYKPVRVDSLITIHDTTYVALEREKRGYKGDEYEAVVSGIDPMLESIKVFPRTAYITNTVVQKKRWSWGVTAGAGIYWNGSQVQPGLGVVAGFGYNF